MEENRSSRKMWQKGGNSLKKHRNRRECGKDRWERTKVGGKPREEEASSQVTKMATVGRRLSSQFPTYSTAVGT